MPMLTYAAKESPVGITIDLRDMNLVAAAKDGDHQAYAELCRWQLLRAVLRIMRNLEDAQDTLHQALLKAYLHIEEFGGRSAFSSWLIGIAINYALMKLR